ncbi:MAG: UDP-N-acetylmuramate--L-alanine ligase [Chlorobi bacterium]|nr:UDP-N-acetylmuramate--L-alanine ligase [Chlorobiota bacterium]
MEFKNLKYAYFIGIGGIGMSALARFFHRQGVDVSGYDRVPSVLTSELEMLGIQIHYEEDINWPAEKGFLPYDTLVVYTPAIPGDNKEILFFREAGFDMKKRAEVLGLISNSWDAVCVAGTHGKTTISTLAAHLYTKSKIGCSAFIGGIAKNYNTNYLHSSKSPYVILEADEFDRSFLHLNPYLSVISSMDADHLDIYGNKKELEKSFREFVSLTRPGGTVIVKKGLPELPVPEGTVQFVYSLDEDDVDFYASNILMIKDRYIFDLNSPFGKIEGLQLGIPGLLNVENAVAACALALIGGVSEEEIKKGLASFKGIKRRFDYIIKTRKFVFIDDYAHHPAEIKATVKSVKAIYEGKRIMGIFQPHLYTRTRDFAKEFAEALDILDRVILLDIYPARELPVEGVTSELIMKYMKNAEVEICEKEELFDKIIKDMPDVLLTMGAGDIDREVPELEAKFRTLMKL